LRRRSTGLSELGLHLNIRCEASSGEAVCQLVAQGLGVTIEDPLLASGFEQGRGAA
jgi:DNA-binding transcriptional LysR family regulator